MPWANGRQTASEEIAALEQRIASLRSEMAMASLPMAQQDAIRAQQKMGGLLAQPLSAAAPARPMMPPQMPPQMRPQMPSQMPPQMPPQMPSQNPLGGILPAGPLSMQNGSLQELYGLLARYGDDPAQIGNQFANAALQEQQIAHMRKQDMIPGNMFARLFGQVPLGDLTPESAKAVVQSWKRDGIPDLGLMQFREKMSQKEEGFLNEAINNAMRAGNSITQATTLAKSYGDMAAQGFRGGVPAAIDEWLKSMLGSTDAVTLVRQQFEQMKNSAAMLNLPPGPASDIDVKFARQGWPKSTDGPAAVAQFLRGFAKMQAIQYAQASHAAGYLRLNKSQAGQLEDWEANKTWLLENAAQQYGLTWDTQGNPLPTRPGQATSGAASTQLSDEDRAAAKAKYGVR